MLMIKNKLSLNIDDSMRVDKMSVKDGLFVQYLNKEVGDSMLFTIQDKCSHFISSAIVNEKLDKLKNQREASFILPFKNKSIENRVKIFACKNDIPYNGFSLFKIEYLGKFPDFLIRANRQMNELNSERPRKGFVKVREKISEEL